MREQNTDFFQRLKDLRNQSWALPEIIPIGLVSLLVLPYFLLCAFDNPSIDDYSFALKNLDLGFWGAQASAFTTWNGRYVASFILCAHPLAYHCLSLYKIIPVLLLVLSIHGFYYFISSFGGIKKSLSYVLAVLIVFEFLNRMPTLVQGIYWAPGAITYQLANILLLYFIANLVRMNSVPNSNSLKLISGLLIIAICGSNETSMLVVNLALLCFLFYYLVMDKKINRLLLFYFLLSLIFSIVMVKAPGNSYRDVEYTYPNEKNILFTLVNSLKAGLKFPFKWALSSQLIIVTLLSIFSFFQWGATNEKKRNPLLILLMLVVFGYLILSATFSTGFWSIGLLAPDRTVNVSYWIFILLWFSFFFLLSQWSCLKFPTLKNKNFQPLLLLCIVLLLLTIKSPGNYFNACKDLISGKAYVYNKEFRWRTLTLQNSDRSKICEVPSYSMFPTSVFNEDITGDETNWNNLEFARFYGANGVKVINHEPFYSYKYLLNFDDPASRDLKNASQITNEVSFSPPNSSLQNGPDSYSVIFEKKMSELEFSSPKEITAINLRGQIFSSDSIINAVLVLTIDDPSNGKNILWLGKDIAKNNYPSNKWTEEKATFQMTVRSILDPKYKISAYLWNRGKGKIYLDDFLVTIY